jgi:hypothetical protein
MLEGRTTLWRLASLCLAKMNDLDSDGTHNDGL